MKIGLHEWSTERRSNFEKNVELAHKYGYECIELLQKNTDDYLKDHSLAEMKALLEKANIRPSAMSGLIHFNLLDTPEKKERQFSEFNRLLDICVGIGCKVLIMVASPRNGVNDQNFINKEAVMLLKEYGKIAAEKNIDLAVEFMGFKWGSINDFKNCYKVVQETGMENIGIALDAFHFYANGSDLEDLRKADGKKIFALHINYVTGRPVGEYVDDSLRVLPYDGEIPLVKFFGILKEIGCTQTPCMELFSDEMWDWEPVKAIRIFKERTERVLSESGYLTD